MAKYTVIFLFNENLTKVLLVHKKRSVYAGRLNGIGGHTEDRDCNAVYPLNVVLDVNSDACAIRETKEETDVNIGNRLKGLVSCQYPSGVFLAVYYGVINEHEVRQMEDEELEWVDVADILNSFVYDKRFAGEGNVQYFINAALEEIQNADM